MYGVEAASTGLGGLAAQAPSDLYFGQALGIQNVQSPLAGAPPSTGVSLAFSGPNDVGTPTAFSGAAVNASGSAVENPPTMQQSHWSSVLDFHNSVAPWILLAILVLYGWLHVSARTRLQAGRASAGAGVVL